MKNFLQFLIGVLVLVSCGSNPNEIKEVKKEKDYGRDVLIAVLNNSDIYKFTIMEDGNIIWSRIAGEDNKTTRGGAIQTINGRPLIETIIGLPENCVERDIFNATCKKLKYLQK